MLNCMVERILCRHLVSIIVTLLCFTFYESLLSLDSPGQDGVGLAYVV